MFQLFKSLINSIGQAIANDPKVRSLLARHPRLYVFMRKRFTPDEEFGLYLTLGGAVVIVFIFLFFGVVEDLIGQDPLIQSDLRIINLLQIFRTPLFSEVMLFVTHLGGWQIVASGVLAVGLLLLLLKRRHYFFALIISVGGGEVFVWLAKYVIGRQRPPLVHALAPEASFSFPSGHSFVAVAFYGLLCYFLFREARNRFLKVCSIIAGALIILAIGFSRIYLGAHWPSDVLASYASAAAWLAALITALEIRRKFNHREYGAPYTSSALIAAFSVFLFVLWGIYVGYFFRTHPLNAPKAVAENQIAISETDIPQNLFLAFSRTSEDITGRPMEPINIIVVGSRRNLTEMFSKAGWFLTDSITAKSFFRFIVASIFNKSYPEAPGTPSFWNARPNDFAYEQPTAAQTVRERHHVHFWETPFVLNGGENVWFGTAHFDKAIKLSPSVFLPTHTIDPAIDKERDKIKDDLLKTGLVRQLREFQITEPTLGSNQSGDQFFTDGKSFIVFLKN